MAGKALTDRQQRFVLEYPRDCNATKAAIRAGYSENGAQQAGSRLLSNAVIFEGIQAAIERHLAKLDLSLERIIQEAARVGISDIGELFDADGHVIPTHLLPHDIRRCISSIKVQRTTVDVEVEEDGERTTTTQVTTETTEFKLWDKLRALELVGKLKGFMKPEVKVEAGDSWEQVLVRMTAAQAKARALEGEVTEPPPVAARGVGTDHKGHHGSQG